MKIVNRPKVILTTKEAEAFNDTIRLLDSMSMSLENLNKDLSDMAKDAWDRLTIIWDDEAVEVE